MKVAVLVLLVLTSCSSSQERKEPKKTNPESKNDHSTENETQQSFQYQFEYNGCNTGKHNFTDKNLYCKALADDALNKGCATEMRYQKARQDCPDLFGDADDKTGNDEDDNGNDDSDDESIDNPGTDQPNFSPLTNGFGQCVDRLNQFNNENGEYYTVQFGCTGFVEDKPRNEASQIIDELLDTNCSESNTLVIEGRNCTFTPRNRNKYYHSNFQHLFYNVRNKLEDNDECSAKTIDLADVEEFGTLSCE